MTALVLIVLLFALLGAGLWVAYTLGIVAWVGIAFFSATKPEFNLFTSYWHTYASTTLASLPLFIWMGEILYRTKLAEELFAALAPWLERIPGRLLHVNVLSCGLFGAVSGSSAATCATVAKICLPELERRGYNQNMSLGSLCGAGTLGLLVPPSIVMIVYAVAADVSIIRMFLAGVFPALLVLLLFSGYIFVHSLLNPRSTPSASIQMPLRERLHNLRKLAPVVLLVALVFLSMMFGIATATEAAAFGVLGALIIALWGRVLNWTSFKESLSGALRTSGMIMFILGGASFLTVAMGFTGIPQALSNWVVSLGLSPYMLIFALTLIYILMGCALDGVSMIVLTTAIVLPMVQAAGFDPIWFGIYIVIMIELAQITPPVGFNLFVLQNMSGRSLVTIASAAFPFFLLMLAATVIIVVYPDIVTWFPRYMMG